MKKGVLLVNLGSPDTPQPKDVKRYLDEFLMDERVIDLPYILRAILVKGIVLNTRPKKSAEAYQKIWWEEGSPLIVLSERLQEKIDEFTSVPIALAMRYGSMTIEKGMQELSDKGVTVSFFLYHLFFKKDRVASHMTAPLILLWIICLIVAFPIGDSGLIPAAYLPGAGFFIVPLFAGLIMLWLHIFRKRVSYIVMLIFAVPAIFIFAPFVVAFPVALGMGILFVAAILSSLLFSLLLPVLGHYRSKGVLAAISLIICVVFVGTAFAKAEFSSTQPQKTSLIYFQDADSKTAQWATYDQNLSNWTKEKIGQNPTAASDINANAIDSKYGGAFTYLTDAEYVQLPEIQSRITVDTIINGSRTIKMIIDSDREVERWEVFCDNKFQFKQASVNGTDVPLNDEGIPFARRRGNRIISYYVSNNAPLVMELTFDAAQSPEFDVYAASFDLLDQPRFNVSQRPEETMPMPFVLNDAIVVKKHITSAQNE